MSADHRAWIVDLDGTLYHPWPVKLAMGCELIMAARAEWAAIRAFRRAHEKLRQRGAEDGGACPFRAQLKLASADSGETVEALEAAVHKWMIERPGRWLRLFRRRKLIGEIRRFKAGGGRCAVVSDYPAHRKLKAMEIDTLFDAVIASGEAGGPTRLKPDPQGVLLAARALDVAPGECLVIGDRADADGEAARLACMTFRHINHRWPDPRA